LVFCIGSDRRRKMKTHPVIDVAQLLWHRDTSPKINLMKEKNRSAKHQRTRFRWRK
jgi:hypothetical protein